MNEKGTPAKKVKAFVAYVYEPAKGEKVDVVTLGQVPNMGWKDLIALGSAQPDAEMDKRHEDIAPGHCACLIYPSGTTGDPKAVMISHDNIAFESGAVFTYLQEDCGMCTAASQERILSYLPLSHVAGMMIDIVCPLVGSAMSPAWTTIYFARNYDLKAGSIKERLQVARPTLFLGVPIVWEKIADKIRAIGAANTGVKKALGDWSKGVAAANSKSKQLGEEFSEPMGLTVALTIMNKVKENLGLHLCKFCMTGAAPIRVDTLEYFASLGIIINEVYGMSECTGAVTISTPNCFQWGSCGFELPGVQVRSFKVNDADFTKKENCPLSKSLEDATEACQGELCYRGRDIMMGYMAQPDFGSEHIAEIEKKNSETIDAEGWLHSGDRGMITVRHMCKITGRFKELIIGEGGENIAPVPIEDHVKKMCDGICEVMMVGDKRKYNVALVTLKAVGANGEIPGTDALDAGAKRVNPAVTKISEAMDDPTWIQAVSDAIQSANKNTKVCTNNAFTIQKFTILPLNFSEQNNELTPTKKLKRKIVETRYAAVIEKMYKTDGTYVRF